MSFRQQLIATFALTMLGLIFLVFTLGVSRIIEKETFILGLYCIIIVPFLNIFFIAAIVFNTPKKSRQNFLIPVLIIGLLSIVILIPPGTNFGRFIYWLGLNLVLTISNLIGGWFFQPDN